MKNGAMYVRVSTEEQAHEGYSIEAQIKAIKEYAFKNDIFIDKQFIFKDEGISGKRANKRPAFMEMVKQAKMKPRKFDVILVHKFDRFARNREDSVVYKSLLRKEYGIDVISICEPLDLDNKMNIILESILEAMAEYYSLNLSDEVKKGQLEKHKKGELQTRPSYGYDVLKDKNILVVNEQESQIVKYIFERFAIDHVPIITIARELHRMGVRNKNGNQFENRTLYYILNNPVYIGKLRYTPRKRKGCNFDDPNTIIVDGKHEAVISLELWKRTQIEMTKNKKWRKSNQTMQLNPKYWISGLIRCKQCNCTMVSYNNKGLRCNGYQKGKCFNKTILDLMQLKQLIIQELKESFSNERIENIIIKNNKTNTSIYETSILKDTLKSMSKKKKRIKEAYINGIDTLSEYRHNKFILEKEEKELEERISKIGQNSLDIKSKEIYENGKKVYELLVDPNIEELEKYKIAHRLFEKIVFNNEMNELEIYYN